MTQSSQQILKGLKPFVTIPIWLPLMFFILMTLWMNHPLLEKIDRFQCGLKGHGKTYRENGGRYCLLCGAGSELGN